MSTARIPTVVFMAWVMLVVTFHPVSARRLFGEPQVSALPGPLELVPASTVISSWPETLLSGYLSNEQLEAWSLDFTSRCSSISRRFSIGKSVRGLDLWVIEIAANPGKVEAKPNFKYVGNMHGDEPGSRMLLPMLAEWLCSKRTTDARASSIIDGMHLFLMPTMNPDGFSMRRRYNAAGADLNRNFPSPFLTCPSQRPESCDVSLLSLRSNRGVQPETAAIMAWTSSESFPFTAAANLHEGAIVTNYPWDGYQDGSEQIRGIDNPTSEQKTYAFLSKTYSKLHPGMKNSREFKDGITNGAGWYPIYGSMQDWDYTAAGCMELTLELSEDKYPPASTLASQWSDNRDSLLALPIAAVLGGVSGQVRNAQGNPIQGAVVKVDGVLFNVPARGPLAYYNRPLAPGTYKLEVTAPGFCSKTADVVVPESGHGVRQDFTMVKCRRAARLAAAP